MRQKYADSERDGETGLDFMQARYYSSMMGRFTGVDPSSNIKPVDPQTWNRYTYSFNNPLLYVDKNGKWPTETHNALIEAAFPGLSRKDVEFIQRAAESVDVQFPIHLPFDIPGVGDTVGNPITLYPENAYMHAMIPEGMTETQAREAYQQWIDTNAEKGKTAQQAYEDRGGTGLNFAALVHFGQGSHTLMDNTSPAHRDFQKYNIPRTVITVPGLVPGAIVVMDPRQFIKEMKEHKEQESRKPTEAERRRAIADMQAYFRRIFGDEWYRRAISNPRQ